MTEVVIREVEDDPREGIVVTIEEGAVGIRVPAPCAGCLGTATKRLPPVGVSWMAFPYCDTCVPPRGGKAGGELKPELRRDSPPVWWGIIFGPLFWLVGLVWGDVGGRRGSAVKQLLSESGTVRLGFRNRQYARMFVEANGAQMPPE